METENKIPRRSKLYEMTPAETAIYVAINEVEKLPPDIRLTDAVNLLGQAKDNVSDYVDGINRDIINNNQDDIVDELMTFTGINSIIYKLDHSGYEWEERTKQMRDYIKSKFIITKREQRQSPRN